MSFPAKIEERIGYRFQDPSLLEQALTHPSSFSEGESRETNQRLEFLGDAVLELVISEILFEENPSAPEGPMTSARASLVCGPSLTSLAQEIGLGEALILGPAARNNQINKNPAALEDAFEAMVGAVYLDGGLEAARTVCSMLFRERSFDVTTFVSTEENPKGALQELIQADPMADRPLYEIVDTEGPPHERVFQVTVSVNGEICGRGTGTSKKTAETEAARQALANLRNERAEGRNEI